jgi:hypothetical protein
MLVDEDQCLCATVLGGQRAEDEFGIYLIDDCDMLKICFGKLARYAVSGSCKIVRDGVVVAPPFSHAS